MIRRGFLTKYIYKGFEGRVAFETGPALFESARYFCRTYLLATDGTTKVSLDDIETEGVPLMDLFQIAHDARIMRIRVNERNCGSSVYLDRTETLDLHGRQPPLTNIRLLFCISLRQWLMNG